MQPVILLKKIRVTLGNNFSLSVESLALQPRRIYALTGPNGAGKSTLLACYGVVDYTAGRYDRIRRQRSNAILPSSGKESPWWSSRPTCSKAA